MAELNQGDLVTHWTHGDQVGYIAEIEPDQYSWDDPVYHVVWPPWGRNAIAVPYRKQRNLRRFEIPASSKAPS